MFFALRRYPQAPGKDPVATGTWNAPLAAQTEAKMTKAKDTTLNRRALLARVGLLAGAAYVAPTLVGLNAAHASGASRGGNSRGGNSGPSRGRNSGPSRGHNSGPSRGRNSGPSRGRNSRPSQGGDWPREGHGPGRSQGGDWHREGRAPEAGTPRWMRDQPGTR